jgi:hypothetical protein
VTLRETRLHNVGNLTLLTEKLNPALSNEAFAVKRPEITRSLLALNAYFQPSPALPHSAPWNEDAILARSESLFATAVQLWPHPRGRAEKQL